MNIYDWIISKPTSLRLGQYWVLSFLAEQTEESAALFNERDNAIALETILSMCLRYNWDIHNLPLQVNLPSSFAHAF